MGVLDDGQGTAALEVEVHVELSRTLCHLHLAVHGHKGQVFLVSSSRVSAERFNILSTDLILPQVHSQALWLSTPQMALWQGIGQS